MNNPIKGACFTLCALALALSACSAKDELAIKPDPTHNPPPKAQSPTPKAQKESTSPFLAGKGRYKLTLSPDAGWHHHALEITGADDKVIEGRVSVDLGIGPQGRAPMPDEKVHKLGFRATRDKDPHHLRFSVSVGELSPALYTFDLHLCPGAGADRCGQGEAARLTGEVVVASQPAGEERLKAEALRLD